jgi:glycolate oxidase FAD binding subunit
MTALTTEAAVQSAVAAAIGAGSPLAIRGGGTKAGLGRPAQAAATLDLSALSGITLYEPAEMVIAARAGTPLAEIEATLAAKGQMLAFEPADLRALYGSGGEPTIGAVVATNNSGPRRLFGGAARDSLIGVRFVNGKGEVIRSGGRVMKNVTGLDIARLHAGAHGTLGVLTEVTFRVVPKPAEVATVAVDRLDGAAATALMAALVNSPFEITGAAYLPAEDGRHSRTLARIEGFPEQISYRLAKLTAIAQPFGRLGVIEAPEADALWRRIRDVSVLAEPRDRAVWRLAMPPTAGHQALARIGAQRPATGFLDWAGGLVWLATPEDDDAGAALIHTVASDLKGHATLMRGSDALRARASVFQPLPGPLAALNRRVKASLDPAGLFNPGRMVAGV